jgi:hypothetical protein
MANDVVRRTLRRLSAGFEHVQRTTRVLVKKRFPEPYVTPPPPGHHRCAVRSCPARIRPEGELICPLHDEVTPGDLGLDVPVKVLFPWR